MVRLWPILLCHNCPKPILSKAIATWGSDDLLAEMSSQNVPAGPINSVGDNLSSAHAQRQRQCFHLEQVAERGLAAHRSHRGVDNEAPWREKDRSGVGSKRTSVLSEILASAHDQNIGKWVFALLSTRSLPQPPTWPGKIEHKAFTFSGVVEHHCRNEWIDARDEVWCFGWKEDLSLIRGVGALHARHLAHVFIETNCIPPTKIFVSVRGFPTPFF